jgi:hypothetical protein
MIKFTVNKDWDQLQSCVIGTIPGPDFFSNIENSIAREALETVVYETEQDLQYLIQAVIPFDVQIWRPNLPLNSYINEKYVTPPINPKDVISVVGGTLYYQKNTTNFDFLEFYTNVKDPSWPHCTTLYEFYTLSDPIKDECINQHGLLENIKKYNQDFGEWRDIINYVQQQQTNIKETDVYTFSSSMVICAGNIKLFAVNDADASARDMQLLLDIEFPTTTNHIIRTNKRLSEICVIPCEGLIICSEKIQGLENIFKDWEIVCIQDNSAVQPLWSILGFEKNTNLVDTVEKYFKSWTGNANNINSATDMLVINDKNVVIENEVSPLIKTLEKYNITTHVVPFKHKSFWGVGLRNSTADLFRSSADWGN